MTKSFYEKYINYKKKYIKLRDSQQGGFSLINYELTEIPVVDDFFGKPLDIEQYNKLNKEIKVLVKEINKLKTEYNELPHKFKRTTEQNERMNEITTKIKNKELKLYYAMRQIDILFIQKSLTSYDIDSTNNLSNILKKINNVSTDIYKAKQHKYKDYVDLMKIYEEQEYNFSNSWDYEVNFMKYYDENYINIKKHHKFVTSTLECLNKQLEYLKEYSNDINEDINTNSIKNLQEEINILTTKESKFDESLQQKLKHSSYKHYVGRQPYPAISY
jgi:chromosome segregation ATPase